MTEHARAGMPSAAAGGASDDAAVPPDLRSQTALSVDAARLAALLDGEPAADGQPAPAARPVAPPEVGEPHWPPLPGRMFGTDLRRLMEQILASAAITDGPFPGLTVGRLRQLLEPGQRVLAEPLLLWLDRAGVLAVPVKVDEPLRHPRPLLSRDPAWIAERLRATPAPGGGAIEMTGGAA